MYYSSGNYEAFARPKKPEGVDSKSAYIVGSGLAALTAACEMERVRSISMIYCKCCVFISCLFRLGFPYEN